MPTIADVARIATALPGAEERVMTGGPAWFVRGKLFAWQSHPWPSIPDAARQIIAAEPCAGVKVADELDALALLETWPEVFFGPTTRWGGPKATFRLAQVEPEHLEELVTEAWYSQAPKYMRREFDARHPPPAS